MSVLEQAAARLREARLPDEFAVRMERLAQQVDEPCVVAVVGRVKAGKSTFINALLGEDLARVGATETTATINYFRYGSPDPARPVRCHWRGGRTTEETHRFLDSLQGNDVEALQRASGIEYLEYRLPNPYLQSVTLVDTPGTGAVVDEHQDRTAEFLALEGQLRERHAQETERLGSAADAVIYLIGQVARTTDQSFLDEFQSATQGRADSIRSVGVMAKIDMLPEIIARRDSLAKKVSEQLKDSLNTVVPVSAGIERVLTRLLVDGDAGLQQMMDALRLVPPPRLSMLLDSEEFFTELEFSDCPLTSQERKDLLSEMPWAVFTTIARLAGDAGMGVDAVAAELKEIAGFGPLRRVLERRFFERGHILRCFRIVGDARQALDDIRYHQVPELRQQDLDERAKRERLLAFVRGAGGDDKVRRELEELVMLTCGGGGGRAERAEIARQELDRALSAIYHRLALDNKDIEALQLLEDNRSFFTDGQFEELRCLFGLYGLESESRLAGQSGTDAVEDRAQFWYATSQDARDDAVRAVAEQAYSRYGLILADAAGQGIFSPR